MKNATSLISLLLIFTLGCGDNDKPKSTMYLSVYEDAGAGISGATVEVYSSKDAWLNGTAPLFTANTNANGQVETTKDFGSLTGIVVFAEKNTKNNWPTILTWDPIPKASDGVFWGSVSVSESLLPEFESASTKTFLITDFRNSSGISVFNSLSACSKDNFVKLGVNMKLTINEGSLLCGSGQVTTLDIGNISHIKAGNQTAHNGEIMYSFATGTQIQIYVNTSFSKVYLYEAGNEAEYTRQN